MKKINNKLQLILGLIVAFIFVFILPQTVNAEACPLPFKCFIHGINQSTCNVKECDHYKEKKREDPKKICEKYGITFPVKELGNCKDYASCRQYCQDPLNQGKCFQFGKSKGISPKEVMEQDIRLGYKDFKGLPIKLGCTDPATCKTFCDQSQNHYQCNEFAKANKLVGGYIDNPENDAVIAKAKEVLGCGTPGECASFCTKPENQQKCTSFAGNVGLSGGEKKVGPGGCTTPETCRTFCQNPENQKNYPGCSVDIRREPPFPYKGDEKKIQPTAEPVSDKNPGPGGCTSDQTCQKYCDDSKNKEECSKYHWSGPGGCTDQASCSSYCQKNFSDPACSKYGGGQYGGDYKEQLQQYEQQKQQNLQQFQQMEGQKQGKQQEYDAAQQKYNAKQQEYNQMQNSGEYQQKMQQYQQMQGQYDAKQQEYNQMQQSKPQAPSTGVQGVTTTRGLLQLIFDALFRR